MRRLGTLDSEVLANRFHDYLLARGMPARVESEDEAWAVWIVEEDHVETAREELTAFRAEPEAERFVVGARSAQHVRVEQRKAERQARRRNRDVGRSWVAWDRRGPVVTQMLFMATAFVVIVSVNWRETGWDFKMQPSVQRALSVADFERVSSRRIEFYTDLREIRSGEVWRLVTPIFLHFGWLHVAFNMLWLRRLGTAIEMRQGHLVILGIVLACAVPSNIGQFFVSGPSFGGMSGVVFGLFGYVWAKGRYDPQSGYYMPPNLAFFVMLFFALCFTGALGPIANTAHAIGLGMGVLLGWAPTAIRRRGGRFDGRSRGR